MMWKTHRLIAVLLTTVGFAQTERISGPRVLGDVADRLQAVWARPVSYEEPIWSASDLSSRGVGPKDRSADIQASALTNRDRAQDAAYLRSVVAAFNRENSDLQYDLIEMGSGFSFVPSKRPQSLVKLSEQSRTLLDEGITVPLLSRVAFEHVSAIAEALTTKLGLRVDPSTAIMGNGFERLFSGTQGAVIFEWGTNSEMPAREALSDLLLKSATTMSWRLNCQPTSNEETAFCVLNVSPLLIETKNEQGKRIKVPLQYDRCEKCQPPIPPPPVPIPNRAR